MRRSVAGPPVWPSLGVGGSSAPMLLTLNATVVVRGDGGNQSPLRLLRQQQRQRRAICWRTAPSPRNWRPSVLRCPTPPAVVATAPSIVSPCSSAVTVTDVGPAIVSWCATAVRGPWRHWRASSMGPQQRVGPRQPRPRLAAPPRQYVHRRARAVQRPGRLWRGVAAHRRGQRHRRRFALQRPGASLLTVLPRVPPMVQTPWPSGRSPSSGLRRSLRPFRDRRPRRSRSSFRATSSRRPSATPPRAPVPGSSALQLDATGSLDRNLPRDHAKGVCRPALPVVVCAGGPAPRRRRRRVLTGSRAKTQRTIAAASLFAAGLAEVAKTGRTGRRTAARRRRPLLRRLSEAHAAGLRARAGRLQRHVVRGRTRRAAGADCADTSARGGVWGGGWLRSEPPGRPAALRHTGTCLAGRQAYRQPAWRRVARLPRRCSAVLRSWWWWWSWSTVLRGWDCSWSLRRPAPPCARRSSCSRRPLLCEFRHWAHTSRIFVTLLSFESQANAALPMGSQAALF
jgi:hypothetical protein